MAKAEKWETQWGELDFSGDILITDEMRDEIKALMAEKDIRRYQAIEELMPQLVGRVWCENAKYIVVK